MTTAYIDLDYLHDFHPLLLNEIADEIVSRELTKINLPFNKTHLVITVVRETGVDCLIEVIEKIIAHNFIKVTLVINFGLRKIYQQLLSKKILNTCEVIPFNYYLFYCMQDLERRKARNISWNWSNEKGYFPTGNLARHNRVGFLKQLYDLDLLANIIWTFPVAHKQKLSILKYFIDNFGEVPINFEEFFNYCAEHAFVDNQGMLDDIESNTNGGRVYNTYIHSVSQFKLSNFTILSETNEEQVTEKTWMAILNQHPFIMLSNSKFWLNELKELGFKTFDNYLPYSEYADNDDLEIRWQQTIENIRVFPKILQDRREEISADIEHNYNLCIDLRLAAIEYFNNNGLKDYIKISTKPMVKIADILGIDLLKKYKEQEQVLLEEESNKKFIEKYTVIKAEHWPEIYNKIDFYSLPENIKQECKEVFNFPLLTLEDLTC